MTNDVPKNYSEAMVRLKSRVSSMEDRPQQDFAAKHIEQTILNEGQLVCQAGTGVGKSNAALIPAIVSGKRVVYATATKILQSQIFEKDLPFLAEHLGVDFTYATLKGWSSYVCHAKLAECEDPDVRAGVIDAFEKDSDHTGEREAFTFDIENRTWSKLSIGSSECPGRSQCPFGEVCKPQAARDRAALATVVVVNHSVLATDALIQAMTAGAFSFIGPRDALVVDEAHELEEFVSGVLGEEFSAASIHNLIGEARGIARKIRLEESGTEACSDLALAVDDFFEQLPEGRVRQADVVANSEPYEALYSAYLKLRTWLLDDETLGAISKLPEADRRQVRNRRERMIKICSNKVEALTAIMLADDTKIVRYVEVQTRRFRGTETKTKILKSTPVSIAEWARANLWPLYPSAVLISATVLVEDRADFIVSRVGLDRPEVVDAGTPFNYAKQAVLYVPQHIAEPSGKTRVQWEAQSAEMTKMLVELAGGGALLLFTSNKQLTDVWERIVHRLPFECRRQGDGTNASLMSWFRNERDGVLFATRSFFTGASFEGDTCRLVVIDKLPFPVPTEPVFEARCEEIKRRGGSDFNELTIPMMTLPLQQGFGRLIRTKNDRGVVAILDPRLKTKGYGTKIIKSLPKATLSTEIADVNRFFRASA